MQDFLDRLVKHAQKRGVTSGIDMGLAKTILQNASFSNALSGLKLVAKIKSKPVVAATLIAIIETAMED